MLLAARTGLGVPCAAGSGVQEESLMSKSAEIGAIGVASPAPGWAQRLRRTNDHLMFDLLGGPRPWKLSWVINLQKAGTFPVLALMMWHYSAMTPAATSPAAWIYLALHGSYGLVWLLKDLAFPDPGWQRRATIGGGLATLAVLLTYWSFGWLLISGAAEPSYPLPEPVWFALCISLCILGCAVMIAADAQKYFTLRLQRGLIRDGVHRYVRHPNYLGEMMVYGSFALLVWHWWPALVLAVIWGGLFATNMAMKEASLSRHPGWKQYRERSWWLVPYLF
jgi:protein-S-isoprenylcysteine O-methyltransferase Ste14